MFAKPWDVGVERLAGERVRLAIDLRDSFFRKKLATEEAQQVIVEAAARVYVELIRGTPLLVQLLIGFYVVANAVGLENRYVVGALVLALFSGAYMAEIFRGGLAAIPAGQRDAARAIGLTPWQSMRLVILPQAIRLVLPAVAGQLVSLIKDSSLLSVIAVSEFTLAAQEVNSFT